MELSEEMQEAIIELIATKLYVTVDLEEDYLDRLTVKVGLHLGEHVMECSETVAISKQYCNCSCGD